MNEKLKVNISKIGHEQGVHYQSINIWLAAIEMHENKNIFEVGLVSDKYFVKYDYPHALSSLEFPTSVNYLLINTAGKIIAWNHDGENYQDQNFLNERYLNLNENIWGDWQDTRYLEELNSYIKKNISTEYEIDLSIYNDVDIDHKSSLIVPAFNLINAELLEYLGNNPQDLHSLHWRTFEELLAELFKNHGFETELGPGQADGGVDLRLIQRSDVGEMLILVQAKKYAEHRKIQLDPVKALWASVEDEQANKGILVSTSEFIPAAKKFADRHPYRLELAGPEKIVAWLRQIGKHT